MLVHPSIRRKVAVLYISFVSFFFTILNSSFTQRPFQFCVILDLRDNKAIGSGHHL